MNHSFGVPCASWSICVLLLACSVSTGGTGIAPRPGDQPNTGGAPNGATSGSSPTAGTSSLLNGGASTGVGRQGSTGFGGVAGTRDPGSSGGGVSGGNSAGSGGFSGGASPGGAGGSQPVGGGAGTTAAVGGEPSSGSGGTPNTGGAGGASGSAGQGTAGVSSCIAAVTCPTLVCLVTGECATAYVANGCAGEKPGCTRTPIPVCGTAPKDDCGATLTCPGTCTCDALPSSYQTGFSCSADETQYKCFHQGYDNQLSITEMDASNCSWKGWDTVHLAPLDGGGIWCCPNIR